MKITDMIISAILKRGIVYEARNVDTMFTLPTTTKSGEDTVASINLKIDHMTLKVEREEKN